MSYTDYLRETRVPHDWCREIDERCKTIDAAIADQTILLDAVSTCRIVGDHPKTADLCQKREPCLRTSLLCQTTDGPILAPDTVPEIWGLSEMGIYTDLVSFQEISEVLKEVTVFEPEISKITEKAKEIKTDKPKVEPQKVSAKSKFLQYFNTICF